MKYLLVILAFCSFNVFAKPVNINSADAKTISESLSGVGMKKAEAIVKFRKEKGPFATAMDLAKVKGIGEKTIEKNKGDILVSDVSSGSKKQKEKTQ
ncbi:ComEA family DNA-binding protein [Methylomarinum vadi]|uniref:ComEA family DNA-binding protein n=1 Tax=Methylomarinum vadi TaxID=438855 RepID=UPI0004DEE264|nr:helix-hairpin-helix domain-containing protein [Methylomarinum vadi]